MHLLSRMSRYALSPKLDARRVPVTLQSERIHAVLDPIMEKETEKDRSVSKVQWCARARVCMDVYVCGNTSMRDCCSFFFPRQRSSERSGQLFLYLLQPCRSEPAHCRHHRGLSVHPEESCWLYGLPGYPLHLLQIDPRLSNEPQPPHCP